jgi:hypothetical protein
LIQLLLINPIHKNKTKEKKMKIGDVMLAAICGLVIVTSVAYIDPHFSTSNVEEQKTK